MDKAILMKLCTVAVLPPGDMHEG